MKSKDSLDDVHGKINFDLKIPLKYGTMYSMKDSKPDEKVTFKIKLILNKRKSYENN